MNTTTLIILICAGILVLFIGFVVIVRLNNGKRSKKLQDSLKKVNQEKQDLEQNDKIHLPKENTTFTSADLENNGVFKSEKSASVEDYVTDMPAQEEINFENSQEFKPEINTVYNPMGNTFPEYKSKNEDDFEAFMNEHSYSRKVFNKPLIEKIKKLPPDVRMLLLSNVFDRFDDEK